MTTSSSSGLTQPDVHVLLRDAGIAATDAEVACTCSLTDGNPLLLRLFLALRQPQESFAEALHQLPSAPSLALLLSRVLRRLGPTERDVLMALSVFTAACPEDAWHEPHQQAALAHVLARNLAQRDASGGLTLQPMLRTVLAAQLSAESMLQAHRLGRWGDGRTRRIHGGGASLRSCPPTRAGRKPVVCAPPTRGRAWAGGHGSGCVRPSCA